MNKVEFEQAVESVHERIAAVLDGEQQKATFGKQRFVGFAGTDLPAGEVIAHLNENVALNLDGHLMEIPLPYIVQGIAVNAFLVGFECGKRSK